MKRLAVIAALVASSGLAHADKGTATGFAIYKIHKETVTHDCSTDATVVVEAHEDQITFTGACTKIKVSGQKNVVTIESVKTLEVPGADNTITVDATDSISTNGKGNTILWKKPLNPKLKQPSVSNHGLKNAIAQDKEKAK